MREALSCQSCRFWLYLGAGETVRGQCRRNAPRPETEDAIGDASVVWPDTRASDWCGEHEAVEA